MIIVLLEDSATEARSMEHWFGILKGQYLGMSKLQVLTPHNDWWVFIESRLYPGVPAASPIERARNSQTSVARLSPDANPIQRALRWSKDQARRIFRKGLRPGPEEYWLIDLHLANADQSGRDKLELYLAERCRQVGELDALVRAVRNNVKVHWDDIKGGVALAAYAKQHLIPHHFVSDLAKADIKEQRNLLSWLAMNESPSRDRPYYFTKSLLAGGDVVDLSDDEDAEYAKVFRWISHGGRTVRTSRDPRYFIVVGPIKITKKQWDIGSWVATVLIAVILCWLGLQFSG